MQSLKKTKNIHHILFILIIVLSLTNIILTFTLTKKNYITDEIWSYGLSNGYYDPFIFSDGDVTSSRTLENYKNINTWITSDVFKDYIVVNEGERFAYDSVWFNQMQDVHPPFYYAILHTICSFFPETFSVWFGMSINIVCFLLIAVLLYKLCYNLTSSPTFSLISLAFYTFNSVAVDTYIYIRMYALVTFFYIALLYFIQKLLSTDTPSFPRHFLPLVIITCLGTLTHYHFAVYAFLFSACTCFYFLFRKKWKNLIIFSISMLLGIGLVFIIFPGITTHLSLNIISADSDWNLFRYNFRYIKALIGSYQIGIPLPVYKTMLGSYLFLSFLIIILLLIPFWFLFRKEPWMNSLLTKSKNVAIALLKNTKNLLTSIPPILYMTIIVISGMILFFCKTLSTPQLERFTIRYLFPTIAVYYFSLSAILYYIARSFHLSVKWCKVTFITIVIICSLTSNLIFKTTFAFPLSPYSGKTMDKLEEGSTCIIALSAGWLMTALPFRLLQIGNIYVIDTEYLFSITNKLENLPSSAEGSPIYLLLDTSLMISEKEVITDDLISVQQMNYVDYTPEYTKEDYIEYFSSLPYAEKFEQVGRDAAYYSTIEIYQLR